MATSPRLAASVALVLLTVLAGSCTDDRPQPLAAPSPVDPGPGSLRVEGPRQIAPLSSAQLTAYLTWPGRPNEDVTSRVQWKSSKTSVAMVDAAGVVSAHAVGEVIIHAVLGEQIAGHAIRAVPDGTYELSGTVLPYGPQLRARIEVSGGVGPAAVTETSEFGAYTLLGVGGHVRMTVRMQGFVSRTLELDIDQDTRHSVQLSTDGAERLWRLTITPAAVCMSDSTIGSNALTADVLLMVSDTHVALLPAEQPELTFHGEVRSGAFTLVLGSYDDFREYTPPGLRMRDVSGSSVEALGSLHAAWNGRRYAGLLEGYLGEGPYVGQGYCHAANHEVTLEEK